MGSSAAMLAGGALGAVLLLWAVIAVLAPGFGAMLAVFGSPLFACLLILRLLTLTPPRRPVATGRRLSELEQDPLLLEQIARRNGGLCRDCGAAPAERLRAILPAGSAQGDLERRFVALCTACDSARSGHPDRSGRA